MKPFNLEAAKRGAKVQLDTGEPVRILCFDRRGPLPIIALVCYQTNDMVVYCDEAGNIPGFIPATLCMAPTKGGGWINVYPNNLCSARVYKTQEEARHAASPTHITTVKIEWEE